MVLLSGVGGCGNGEPDKNKEAEYFTDGSPTEEGVEADRAGEPPPRAAVANRLAYWGGGEGTEENSPTTIGEVWKRPGEVIGTAFWMVRSVSEEAKTVDDGEGAEEDTSLERPTIPGEGGCCWSGVVLMTWVATLVEKLRPILGALEVGVTGVWRVGDCVLSRSLCIQEKRFAANPSIWPNDSGKTSRGATDASTSIIVIDW